MSKPSSRQQIWSENPLRAGNRAEFDGGMVR